MAIPSDAEVLAAAQVVHDLASARAGVPTMAAQLAAKDATIAARDGTISALNTEIASAKGDAQKVVTDLGG